MARRLRTGDEVEIFDGKGTARRGVIDEVSGGRLLVRFHSPPTTDPEPERRLTIAMSPPRGERMAFAVEKLSELGCHRLAPVVFRRSEDAGVRTGTGKIRKWRRRAIESAKQCGRNRLLDVADPVSLAEALGQWPETVSFVVLEREAGESLADRLEADRGVAETVILVGPEGGFTEEERRLMRESGGKPARLFDHILRIETAAVAAAALFNAAAQPSRSSRRLRT
jgi:16S rRNA (uracil1498-N3)-methyltransferase